MGLPYIRYDKSAGNTKAIQETQLLLTNCTMRLEASQGHQTWYHSIC